MPKSSAAETASNMLSDLKSRLGFSRSEEYGDSDFDEYDDFDDDEGFNARDDHAYAGYGSDYDESAPVGAFQPASTRSGRFGRADSTPNLVSIDDVKSHTRGQEGLQGDARSSRSYSAGRRNLIDDRVPAESSPAYNASLRDRGRLEKDASAQAGAPREGLYHAGRSDSQDGLVSHPGDGYAPRGLTIVRPYSYEDAAQVTRALKTGDAVVLSMKNTPESLVKRILDFSFGAASALDASVECPAEKVYAIARGNALSEEEKRQLRTKGVL